MKAYPAKLQAGYSDAYGDIPHSTVVDEIHGHLTMFLRGKDLPQARERVRARAETDPEFAERRQRLQLTPRFQQQIKFEVIPESWFGPALQAAGRQSQEILNRSTGCQGPILTAEQYGNCVGPVLMGSIALDERGR